MGYTNAYTAYQNTNIKTASQGKLIVLLYEAAVRNMNSANSLVNNENKIKACDIEKFSTHIQKTQAIITELQVSLDMEKGGEIAKNLMSLYIYFNSELVDISFSHSKEKISFVLNMLNELLDAWKQAANTTATNAPATPVSSALNIEG